MRFHRLAAALFCSAAIHAATLALAPSPARPADGPVRLEARLRPAPPTPAEAPPAAAPVELPPQPEAPPPRQAREEKPRPAKEKVREARNPPAPAKLRELPATFNGRPVLQGGAARQALNQLARLPLYPAEAIAQGLQGEVLLLLLLDGNGNVLAARVERSSGHPLLDQAAASAARQLKALPEGTPREAILPVRFRLD